jgi:hypothetical protein
MVRYLSDIFELGGKMKPNSPINPDGYAAGYRGRYIFSCGVIE